MRDVLCTACLKQSPNVQSSAEAKGQCAEIAGGFSVRRSGVMRGDRCEVQGYTADAVAQLKAMGLVSEVISWLTQL